MFNNFNDGVPQAIPKKNKINKFYLTLIPRKKLIPFGQIKILSTHLTSSTNFSSFSVTGISDIFFWTTSPFLVCNSATMTSGPYHLCISSSVIVSDMFAIKHKETFQLVKIIRFEWLSRIMMKMINMSNLKDCLTQDKLLYN